MVINIVTVYIHYAHPIIRKFLYICQVVFAQGVPLFAGVLSQSIPPKPHACAPHAVGTQRCTAGRERGTAGWTTARKLGSMQRDVRDKRPSGAPVLLGLKGPRGHRTEDILDIRWVG